MSATQKRSPSTAEARPTRSSPEGSSSGGRMRLSEFVQISTPLLVPWTLQLGSVYLLLLALPRLLGPSDYAKATAALSVYLVVTAASVALQARDTSPTPTTSSSEPETDRIEQPASGSTFLRSALVAGLAVLVATPAVAVALHLPPAPLTLLAPAFLLSLLTCDQTLALRRSGGRSSVAIALGAGAAIRVAAGFLLALLGLGFAGILVAIVLAEAVTLGIASFDARHLRRDVKPPSPEHSRWTQLLPAVAAVVSVVLLTQLDLLFAQYRLQGVQAGRYAGAAVTARVLLFVPLIGALLMIRRRVPVDGDDPFHWLHRSLAFTGGMIVILWVGVVLFRAPLTAAVLGASFPASSSLVRILAGAAGFLAVVWQLSYFHVVVRSKAHALLLATAAVEVVVLVLFVRSTEGIAWTTLAGAGVAALLHYVGARAVSRWSPPVTRLRPHEEVTSPPTPPIDGVVALSMIVPCYNPGPALEGFLARLVDELGHDGPNEIIVVSDGSTDDSVQIARRFAVPTVRVLHYTERSGKGHALRVGLSAARGSYVGFIDGDGEIDPEAIGPFLSLMRLYEPDVILGSKRHPMSVVSYPGLRRIMSWVYHKLTRLLFRINVRDTQTGLKVIRSEVLSAVLPRMFEKRYAFDLELLVVARELGFSKVFEAPVRIDYRFSSNVNPDAVFRILLDTAAVFYRRYVLDTYRYAGDRLLLVRNDHEDVEGEDRRA